MYFIGGNPSLTRVLSAYCHPGAKKFVRHQSLISCAFSEAAVGISYQQQHHLFDVLIQYLHNKDASNYNASDKKTQNANETEHLLVA